IRFGIGATSGTRPKLLRIRFFSENDLAIDTPCYGPSATDPISMTDRRAPIIWAAALPTRFSSQLSRQRAFLVAGRRNPACAMDRAPGSVALDITVDRNRPPRCDKDRDRPTLFRQSHRHLQAVF